MWVSNILRKRTWNPPHTTINEFAQNLGGNLHGKVYFFY